MKLHWRDFFYVGMTLISNANHDRGDAPTKNQERLFRSQFGVSWYVCSDVWQMLELHRPNPRREAKHLLWSLSFLKVYGVESTQSRLMGTSILKPLESGYGKP